MSLLLRVLGLFLAHCRGCGLIVPRGESRRHWACYQDGPRAYWLCPFCRAENNS